MRSTLPSPCIGHRSQPSSWACKPAAAALSRRPMHSCHAGQQLDTLPGPSAVAWNSQQRGARLHVPPCGASSSSSSGGAGSLGGGGDMAAPGFSTAGQQPQPQQPQRKTPMQQQILNGVLSISNVPYSSYVPAPETFLHRVDARIKQLWLVAIYVIIGRATPWVRVSVAGVVALVSILVLPRRLWVSQLSRLGLLCGFLLVSTALFCDGIPPVLQPREPTPMIEGLPSLEGTGYNYVLLHVWFVTVTHRSINVALTAASLTFCALQSASLCLVTTPGEEMAMALRWWLSPLQLVGVKVQELALTVLLSLRFLSLVFEEVRNLSLGLASRGVDWVALGTGGSLALVGRLSMRLFGNLFHRSENIAQAMVARGFQGPERQKLYMTKINRTSWLWNIVALAVLAGFAAAAKFCT